MRKVAKLLTDYVIKKSMVDEADREVYEYGFVITLEVGLFLVASLFIALKLDMVLEGIFFFVIFFFFVYCVVGFWWFAFGKILDMLCFVMLNIYYYSACS